jgi:hypothetical protein
MLRKSLVVAALTPLLGTVAEASPAGPPLVLSGIVERDANGDAHAFELYGNFPDNANVRPIVHCDGKLMPAEIMAPPLTTQINVNVEAMAAGSKCAFSLQRLSDGVHSGTRSLVTSAVPIQIDGVADRGVTNGRRFVELYGRFASASTLQARVVCGARYAGGRVEFASFGQINVSMPDAAPASGCAFVLRQPGTGLASPAFGSIPQVGNSILPGFGGYFWGGVPPRISLTSGTPSQDNAARPRRTTRSSLVRGQAFLDAVGFDSARLVITPRMRSGNPIDNFYNLDLAALNGACPPENDFLPCAIRRPEYQAAISTPSLRKIVLTAYDSTSSGPFGESGNFVDPTFWQSTANREAVQREFRDLTYALYQTQHDTGKTFVVASWEADNQAYCGSFYSYWTDPGFRASCGDIASRTAAIAAIVEWFRARRAGIQAGRQLAANAGYGGVSVTDGVEFNMNTLTYTYDVSGTVLRSVLRDVVPVVQPDYALYSSYDSQYRGHMEQDLRQIRDWLAANSPGALLAIGEAGFPRHGLDGVDAYRAVETAKAIQRVGLPIAILWEAFDTNAGDRVHPYGLLDGSGSTRSVMRILKSEVQDQAAEIATNPTARILAAVDRGVTPVDGVAYRFFELYGSFPDGPFAATALCDGVETPVDVVFQSAGQINVRLLHEGVEQRYCTLRLWRSDGSRSLEFGPVVD